MLEKENAKKLKGKMKEKMQPKMGKIDIDYQVLHDAFFSIGPFSRLLPPSHAFSRLLPPSHAFSRLLPPSQVLHDAFFKYQTKPRLTKHGDVYYEGREHEASLREKRPGVLSTELVGALEMETGGPPPWLVNMQRYGPPPSYAPACRRTRPHAAIEASLLLHHPPS